MILALAWIGVSVAFLGGLVIGWQAGVSAERRASRRRVRELEAIISSWRSSPDWVNQELPL